MIFLHNHPSGDPSPSQEDHVLTARLVSAGELLGIRVLDHMSWATGGTSVLPITVAPPRRTANGSERGE